ncbi:hypothetical protein VTJ83DRAFT_2580 [Remersonia thermophila]|uniref:DUF1770-domain-containing protein n=1 Tax=Remersonia thermophila TaxID=72144 RepID=A0ABR4DKM1_9PEZI
MASSIPLQLAETIQTAHIQRHPSPDHDLNPSTAASEKQPVTLEPVGAEKTEYSRLSEEVGPDDLDDEEEDELDTEDEALYREGAAVIPVPRGRRHHLPPMPDLRFEQSYLHSIRNADKWWKVVLITVRDQVVMPFMQGILYNLALCGWQQWNRNARIHGSSVGARLRRWWYGVNNWAIPPEKSMRRLNLRR